jgi:hypothetical protein
MTAKCKNWLFTRLSILIIVKPAHPIANKLIRLPVWLNLLNQPNQPIKLNRHKISAFPPGRRRMALRAGGRIPNSAVRHLTSSFLPLSSTLCPMPFAFLFRLPSSVLRHRTSVIWPLLSDIWHLSSTLCPMLHALCPSSDICPLISAVTLDRERWPPGILSWTADAPRHCEAWRRPRCWW